jgi:CubicO group peptidase (beta-lactamase class C family)
MTKAGLPFAGLCVALVVATPVSARECSAAKIHQVAAVTAAIDEIVDAAVADGFAGGVAMARKGRLIYSRVAGKADRAGQIDATDATLFHVASMTKYFTAILTLAAAEEGTLQTNQPIAPWIDGTQLAERDITFMDLLTHRSGLGSSYAAEGIADAQQALLAIDAAGRDATRTGSFRYSNDGYDLLGIILERIYERRYEDLVRDRLFAPACITHAGFWGDVHLPDPALVSQPLRALPATILGRNYGFLGSAGLLITAAELVRFQLALNAGKVLGRSSLETLFAPRDELSIGASALGAFVVERPGLGSAISVRGYEDWGDNGYLTDYRDCEVILAVLTSRGPAEDSGEPPFRVSISEAIESELLPRLCKRGR